MKAKYSGTPIANPAALARTLRVSLQDLRTIAGAASSRYTDFKIDKKDGSKRTVSGPHLELKLIQKRINREIFERVSFPEYLTGGIKNRDYVQNATIHSRAGMVLALDIENFYPNISRSKVFEVFKHFFRQSDDVANLLADLCTKDKSVPQGACTSSYLANLVFYEQEPRLVTALREQGLTYSRLIDDITISAPRPISSERVANLIKSVKAMLKLQGFRLKQKKTRCTTAANPKELMEVTGLWLNRGRPRVKRAERADIRKEVRKCLEMADMDRSDKAFHEIHDRVSGRVAKLAQLNHSQAKIFRNKLRKTLPIYNENGLRRTRGLVSQIRKTPIGSRASLSYIKKYHQILYRINILSRSKSNVASDLRKKIKKYRPTSTKEIAVHG